jgi:hypothetical protein
LEVPDRGNQLGPENALGRVQVLPWRFRDAAVQSDIKDAFELFLELFFEQPARGLGRLLDAVAGVFIHWCSPVAHRGASQNWVGARKYACTHK